MGKVKEGQIGRQKGGTRRKQAVRIEEKKKLETRRNRTEEQHLTLPLQFFSSKIMQSRKTMSGLSSFSKSNYTLSSRPSFRYLIQIHRKINSVVW